MISFAFRVAGRLRRLQFSVMSALHSRRFASCGPGAMIRSPRTLLGCKHVRIGGGFDAFPGLRLEVFDRHLEKHFTPSLRIGNGVSINYDCHIACVNHIEISDNVLIASRVYITDHSHGSPAYTDLHLPPSQRPVYSKGHVIIERDVWIGEGACILPSVRIGRGAIVGANAVVSRDVPPHSIVAGAPARVIKQLPVPGERTANDEKSPSP